jgi:diacylglycerol kinase family enzyme
MGTENLFARYLHVPPRGDVVAEAIAGGRTRRFDLGRAGRQHFAMLASAGFDAEVIHRLHARREGNISRFNYVPRVLECFRKYEYPTFRLFLDDADTPRIARLAVIMNLPMYAFGLRPAPAARADDGLLDLRLFERGSTFQMLRYMYMVARGRHESLPDVESVQARRVRIESDAPVPFEIDGDPAGWTPVEIDVEPAALEVFVPAA